MKLLFYLYTISFISLYQCEINVIVSDKITYLERFNVTIDFNESIPPQYKIQILLKNGSNSLWRLNQSNDDIPMTMDGTCDQRFCFEKVTFLKQGFHYQLKLRKQIFKLTLAIIFSGKLKARNYKKTQIFNRNIIFEIDNKLNVSLTCFKTPCFDDEAYLLETEGQYGCIATKHQKLAQIKLNQNDFNEYTELIKRHDVIKFTWKVSLMDHGKKIQCISGYRSKTKTIKVNHYPNAALISPMVDETLARNKPIKCSVIGGYPKYKAVWRFINSSMPVKGSISKEKFFAKHYNITEDGTVLIMKKTALLKSNWTFECTIVDNTSITVKNHSKKLGKQTAGYIRPRKLINFRIKKAIEKIDGEIIEKIETKNQFNTNNQTICSNSGLIAFLVLVGFMLTILAAVSVWFYKAKIRDVLFGPSNPKPAKKTVLRQDAPLPKREAPPRPSRNNMNSSNRLPNKSFDEIGDNEKLMSTCEFSDRFALANSHKSPTNTSNNNNNHAIHIIDNPGTMNHHNPHHDQFDDDSDDNYEDREPYTEIVGTLQQRNNIDSTTNPSSDTPNFPHYSKAKVGPVDSV